MRLAALSSDTMTPEQVGLYREILSGPRGQGPRAVLLATGAGGLAGPFNVMLYAPAVGHALQELGAAIRFRTELTPRVREMAILVVAQAWDSAYERSSHEPIGRDAGLTDPEIKALRAGTDPGFTDKGEQVAYSVVRSLTGPADLDDQQYHLAVTTLGEQALVELSTLVGYYATLALQLRIFRVGARDSPPASHTTLDMPGVGRAAAAPGHWDSPGTREWELVPGLSSPPLGFVTHLTRSDQISLDIRPSRFRSAKLGS